MRAIGGMDHNESSSDTATIATADNIESLKFTKRSFLQLPVLIDKKQLVAEFESIPMEAWGVSHWDAHCSIDVLLLRGGARGEASDFTTSDIKNSSVLDCLPYISSLLQSDGPFGGAVYAFIFRTKPNGITRVHKDGQEVWHQTHRIHIPIVTNKGAFLMAEGKGKHFPVGEAWTFNNQVDHSVVNGDSIRVHMIIDVNPNPKLADLLSQAVFDPGRPDPERWAMTFGRGRGDRVLPMMPAKGTPLTVTEKNQLGLNPEGFATRVTSLGKKAALLRIPLEIGDIVTSVQGVETSVLSRTALDHISLTHEPGETVTIGVVRGGGSMEFEMQLKPKNYFSPLAQLEPLLRWFGLSGQKH